MLHIMNFLSELLNNAFRSMAGFIPSGREKSKSHPSVYNGRHHIRMDTHTDVPYFLHLQKQQLRTRAI